MGKKFGVSFSWKRALGISATKGRVSRATGLPLTRSGRQRKVGRAMGCLVLLGIGAFLLSLSLVLPADPVQAALRGLHADDENLRGTALEYLDGVLPPAIRARLWPSLEQLQELTRRAAKAESWQTT